MTDGMTDDWKSLEPQEKCTVSKNSIDTCNLGQSSKSKFQPSNVDLGCIQDKERNTQIYNDCQEIRMNNSLTLTNNYFDIR